MNKARQLFYDRKARNDKEVAYYSKFIFNGHFIVFLTIAFGALMLQYSQLLKNLPDNINYNLIIAVILAALTVTPLRTFMKSADSIFLLNFERDMAPYFKQAIIRSGSLRTLLFIVMGGLLAPLYMERTALVVGYICAIVLGVWMIYSGLVMRHLMMKLGITNGYISLLIFLMALSGIYTSLEGLPITIISIILFTLGLIYLFNKNAAHRLLNFDHYIDYEHQLYQAQNKLINMFTDVKGMKDKAVRRRYFDALLPRKSHYTKAHMFEYLFIRNFVRSNDSMWIVVRLIAVGCILMWLVHQYVVGLIIGLFFSYAIIMQASQFYKMQAFSLWPKVWPTPESLVLQGFRKFMRKLTIVTTTVIAVCYILIYPSHFYFAIILYVMMFWTLNSVSAKIEKRMNLLRD
ncbi:ABC transporter permease [Macrococcoides canis]|uniref:ABC transporter permease n=1 Tax=Macrococcoides canis TaxID=1855823 RepID=A0A4R6C854_9STAP|nr:ABC transporter permease [Macrococcus canis]TDM18716.1 ABC transporter permease [Macrococcus canis]TDM21232.1 ABC transporter permease [Macrococcus canis]TDM23926.1 ABC transporter permease [Macrococcus canis]TDM29778.1 ABC transporter permease [Macrococcus canis]TDM35239.1 ABC transporter permease [Macrococcus canis]